jgi:hypothetical protein
MRLFFAAVLTLLAPMAQARPVVVEMFTSLACSSCPPADALLEQVAKDPGVLALSFNVTYWNNAFWSDPDAITAATDRQTWYATAEKSQNVYTPEAVVDGLASMVGSDSGKLNDAIAAAPDAQGNETPVSIAGTDMVTVTVQAGPGGAEIWLFGYDPKHITKVGGGENGGATISEINVVRSVTDLGLWTGPESSMTISRPKGQHLVVLLQQPDGTIMGVGTQ